MCWRDLFGTGVEATMDPGCTAMMDCTEQTVRVALYAPPCHPPSETHTCDHKLKREIKTRHLIYTMCVCICERERMSSLSLPSTLLIGLVPSKVGGTLCFGFSRVGGSILLFLRGEVQKYQVDVFYPSFSAVSTCCIFICDYFLKLIRPHARAVEILCGHHLMMNVYDFLSCCPFKNPHTRCRMSDTK